MTKDTWLLYCVSFFSNAVILVFEITGGRLLAPYLGTSVEIWAGLIAIVLGGMAVGYKIGGIAGDKNASLQLIARVLFASGAAALFAWSVRDLVPTLFAVINLPLTIKAVLVGAVLFMPTVILLAILSPLIAKNLLKELNQSAGVVGTINAVGTMGSIVGAVLTGLVLIPFFGVDTILLAIAVFLILVSFVIDRAHLLRSALFLIFVGVLAFALNAIPTRADVALADISTAYNRMWIDESFTTGWDGQVRSLSMDPFGTQCAMSVKEDGTLEESVLVFEYLKGFDVAAKKALEGISAPRVLVLGGCNYSYPRAFLHHYPDADVDVVEIDAGMTKVAKEYFGFDEDAFPSLSIFHEDARIFLNSQHEPYDIIFMDTFGSASGIPFQLTTQEMFERIRVNLKDSGTLVINVIGAPRGEYSNFISSLITTIETAFPVASLYVFQNTPEQVQNMLIIASPEKTFGSLLHDPMHQDVNLIQVPAEGTRTILTDNYAPVEALRKLYR